jgi:hypothetical protein
MWRWAFRLPDLQQANHWSLCPALSDAPLHLSGTDIPAVRHRRGSTTRVFCSGHCVTDCRDEYHILLVLYGGDIMMSGILCKS